MKNFLSSNRGLTAATSYTEAALRFEFLTASPSPTVRQMDLLFLILIVSTGAMLGNEFSIGFLIHPALSRTEDERFLPAIQVFAKLFGNAIRVIMIAAAFVALVGSYRTLGWH
jgi:hypothetical protein